MTKTLFIPVLALLSLFAASTGYGATRPSATPARHVSDAQIEQKLHTKLAKSKVGKDGFTFRVKSGVVTWDGTTNVMQHKGAATRMARTSGAIQVVNNIKISDAARQKAAGNLSGSARHALVKAQ